MTELHQYTTLIEAQLLDGEETVTYKDADNKEVTVKVTYADGKLTNVDSTNVEAVVMALINEADLANLSTGGKIVATISEAGVLTIAYTHNLTTATANTTWTLGA